MSDLEDLTERLNATAATMMRGGQYLPADARTVADAATTMPRVLALREAAYGFLIRGVKPAQYPGLIRELDRALTDLERPAPSLVARSNPDGSPRD